MDNFDLKKYLAEGKLYKELNEVELPKDNSTIKVDNTSVKIEYTGKNKDYIGFSWKGENGKDNYEETRMSDHKDMDSLVNKIKDEIKFSNRKSLNEEFEDEGAGEEAFDAEFQSAANQIAATIGRELKDKKAENPEALNEALVTSIIAGVLTGNAVIGFVSKMSAKLMKKLNWKKGEDFAEKIHKWAHDNEKSFQEPIRRVLAFFIKDKAKLDLVVKAIYAIVVGSMAAGYGVSAVSSLEKADWFNSSLSALKTLAKSDEAIANAFPAIKSLMV
jgi:hypothetical protein